MVPELRWSCLDAGIGPTPLPRGLSHRGAGPGTRLGPTDSPELSGTTANCPREARKWCGMATNGVGPCQYQRRYGLTTADQKVGRNGTADNPACTSVRAWVGARSIAVSERQPGGAHAATNRRIPGHAGGRSCVGRGLTGPNRGVCCGRNNAGRVRQARRPNRAGMSGHASDRVGRSQPPPSSRGLAPPGCCPPCRRTIRRPGRWASRPSSRWILGRLAAARCLRWGQDQGAGQQAGHPDQDDAPRVGCRGGAAAHDVRGRK